MDTNVFVKIEEYKDVTEIIDLLKNKIAEAKNTITQVETLKSQEDQTLIAWKEDVRSVEERIDYLKNSLMEPKL